MKPEVPLESIESAHEFVTLLAKVVLETKHDLEVDIQRETGGNFPRRLKALKIVKYKLRTLESHLENLARILNDLRSLRRLLFGERTADLAVRPASIGIAEKAETTPSVASSEVDRSRVPLESAVARPASTGATVRKRALSSSGSAHARDLGAAKAVPWYIRPDCKPIDKEKSREANLQN